MLLFFFFLLVDLLVVVGQLFPFIRILDVFYLAQFTLLSSAGYQLAVVLVAVTVLFKCGIVFTYGQRVSFESALLVFNFMIFGYIFKIYGGEGGREDRFWRVTSNSLVSSQVFDFIDYRSQAFLKHSAIEGEPFLELPADAAAVSRWTDLFASQGLPEKMLLVVNESWGVAHDPRIQQALLKPLHAIARGRGEQGNLPFVGATVAGELRELCLLSPNHYNLAPVISGFEDCLPNRLKLQGYRTASVHGAVSLMYDRRNWYPRLGFDESVFFENNAWSQRCYSFPGACDLDLRDSVSGFLVQDGKRFLYWLTLNSHAFYDQRDIRIDRFDCGQFAIAPESLDCRNLKLQAQFFHGLGELLRSEKLSGMAVLVVGDHAPSLTRVQGADAIFVDGVVPWISFIVD